MSRLDWKIGRWNPNSETSQIHEGLRGWQRLVGDRVTYWRWEYNTTEIDPVYDEATGAGKAFGGPWQIPVIHARHVDSPNAEPRDSGLYIRDTLLVVAEFDQLARCGLTDMDIKHATYQRDRIAYDNILFAVKHVDIRGQIRRRDITVALTAEQIRDDELVNDPQFEPYLSDFTRLQQGFAPREDGTP